MCAYFVMTTFSTVRPVSVWTRRLNLIAIAVGFMVGLIWISLAVRAMTFPQRSVPFFMVCSAFVLGAAMLLGAAGTFAWCAVGFKTRGSK